MTRRTDFRMTKSERRNAQRMCRDMGHWFWPILVSGVVRQQQCQFCGDIVGTEYGAEIVAEMRHEAVAYIERRNEPEPKPVKPPLSERLNG